MAITPLPTPVPSTADPVNFDTRADAFLGALPTFATEANALATQVNEDAVEVAENAAALSGYVAVAAGNTNLYTESDTSLVVGWGVKGPFVINDADFEPTVDEDIVLISKSSSEIRMSMQITDRTGTSITGLVPLDGYVGAGTLDDWRVLARAFATEGATAAEMWSASPSSMIAVTPKSFRDANAVVAVAYASTVTVNMSTGHRRSLTASSSFTMGAPTNCRPGDTLEVDITNSAGSIVLAVNSAWKRQGGLGIIGPNNADRSKFIGIVEEVDGSNVMTRGIYNIVRTPT